MACVTSFRQVSQVAERHAGWHVWTDKPIATRAAGNHRHPDPSDGTYAETIIADDYGQLDRELAEQEDNDRACMP